VIIVTKGAVTIVTEMTDAGDRAFPRLFQFSRTPWALPVSEVGDVLRRTSPAAAVFACRALTQGKLAIRHNSAHGGRWCSGNDLLLPQ